MLSPGHFHICRDYNGHGGPERLDRCLLDSEGKGLGETKQKNLETEWLKTGCRRTRNSEVLIRKSEKKKGHSIFLNTSVTQLL